MPSSVVSSFAKQTGKSVSEVEKLWNEAKKQASKAGQSENYAYITGILKKMLGLNERTTDMEIILKEDQEIFDVDGNKYITEGTEQIQEGVDSVVDFVKRFKGWRASDIVGSLWDSMFDEENLSVNYRNDNKYKFYEKIMNLYYDLEQYEIQEIYKDEF